MPMRISRRRFEEIALEAVRELPDEFQEHVEGCVVAVERRASREVMEKLGMPEDEELFGYYEGVALVDRHIDDLPGPPPTITLYSEPLMAACDSEEQLAGEIRITVLHEIAHHLGIDDARLEELGYA
ncbi:MAG TPA: metallopeptidase family protein [Planctomycetota bacterium]|nr:metallopeptidase family protein [Planctomycetota bacterium]